MNNTVKYHITYKEVSPERFNEYLELSKNYHTINSSYEDWCETEIEQAQRYTRWINNNRINISLTFKSGTKWINVKTNKAKIYTKDEMAIVDPIRSYGLFARIVKPEPLNERFGIKYKQFVGLGHYSDNHADKAGKYDYAICYDVNKAFFNACNNLMPDKVVGYGRCPNAGEVGFDMNLFPVMGPSKRNCLYIFSLSRLSGLDRYVEIYTDKLKSAGNDRDLIAKYKAEINCSIGNLKNHNIFLHNMIVYYSNEFIKSKVDEHTLWSNTDSIVSDVRRPDLEVGPEIGQFKIEHEGRFIQAVTGYQWLDEDLIKNKGVNNLQVRLYEQDTGKKFILGEVSLEVISNYKLWEYDEHEETLKKVQKSSTRNISVLEEE